ncbi:hypothetical protein E2C01_049541 [Portunus trituberculatus]|uniref:Uncharacterized protein n=1 Tax=Portunus trituberculatus TaxID=210409 RepID=A0A5B7G5V7_PORTR|nr:hypothetical protein [Portunus trituberculatus]
MTASSLRSNISTIFIFSPISYFLIFSSTSLTSSFSLLFAPTSCFPSVSSNSSSSPTSFVLSFSPPLTRASVYDQHFRPVNHYHLSSVTLRLVLPVSCAVLPVSGSSVALPVPSPVHAKKYLVVLIP